MREIYISQTGEEYIRLDHAILNPRTNRYSLKKSILQAWINAIKENETVIDTLKNVIDLEAWRTDMATGMRIWGTDYDIKRIIFIDPLLLEILYSKIFRSKKANAQANWIRKNVIFSISDRIELKRKFHVIYEDFISQLIEEGG